MVKLKSGKTEDPRLDRLEEFDERSREYPIRRLVTEEAPLRSYGWWCPKWLDQGQEGACVGFAWAHELVSYPVRIRGIDDQFARESIYWSAQKRDQWPGGSYPGASPFYEGTSVLAGAKVVKEYGFMDEYRWAFGIEDVLRTIGYHGPVVLGVNWYEGMYEPDEHRLIEPTGKKMGGHAIMARGVSMRARLLGLRGTHEVVRLRNSWGKEWGFQGDCWIRVEHLEQLLEERGEACVPVSRTRAPVPDVAFMMDDADEDQIESMVANLGQNESSDEG